MLAPCTGNNSQIVHFSVNTWRKSQIKANKKQKKQIKGDSKEFSTEMDGVG